VIAAVPEMPADLTLLLTLIWDMGAPGARFMFNSDVNYCYNKNQKRIAQKALKASLRDHSRFIVAAFDTAVTAGAIAKWFYPRDEAQLLELISKTIVPCSEKGREVRILPRQLQESTVAAIRARWLGVFDWNPHASVSGD
jgi:hypothetical protein